MNFTSISVPCTIGVDGGVVGLVLVGVVLVSLAGSVCTTVMGVTRLFAPDVDDC